MKVVRLSALRTSRLRKESRLKNKGGQDATVGEMQQAGSQF